MNKHRPLNKKEDLWYSHLHPGASTPGQAGDSHLIPGKREEVRARHLQTFQARKVCHQHLPHFESSYHCCHLVTSSLSQSPGVVAFHQVPLVLILEGSLTPLIPAPLPFHSLDCSHSSGPSPLPHSLRVPQIKKLLLYYLYFYKYIQLSNHHQNPMLEHFYHPQIFPGDHLQLTHCPTHTKPFTLQSIYLFCQFVFFEQLIKPEKSFEYVFLHVVWL